MALSQLEGVSSLVRMSSLELKEASSAAMRAAQACGPRGDDDSSSLSEGSSKLYVLAQLCSFDGNAHVITKSTPPLLAAIKPAANRSLWRRTVNKLTPGCSLAWSGHRHTNTRTVTKQKMGREG